MTSKQLTDAELNGIVAGLDDVQKDVLIQLTGDKYDILFAESEHEEEVINEMTMLGLTGKIMVAGRIGIDLQPLGQAVRAHLLKETK